MTTPDYATYIAGLPRVLVGAAALFRDAEGRVLLVEPNYREGWALPGGTVESDDGETPRQGARRETLEEIGLPYEPHTIDIGKNESWTPEFLSLNPNGKIPAIIDPNGPGGAAFALWESGAILLHLSDKTGKLVGSWPSKVSPTSPEITGQIDMMLAG